MTTIISFLGMSYIVVMVLSISFMLVSLGFYKLLSTDNIILTILGASFWLYRNLIAFVVISLVLIITFNFKCIPEIFMDTLGSARKIYLEEKEKKKKT